MEILFNFRKIMNLFKKIMLSCALIFSAFSASSQLFSPLMPQGYQAFLVNGTMNLVIQKSSLAECQAAVNAAVANNYVVASSCKYDIFVF